MDFGGRTGGLSVVLPYVFADTKSETFQASTNGLSDVGFLWQMNIFGGPALTREQFQFLYSADLLKLSSFGDDAAWDIQSDLSDQS
jgi:hypothetical protein